MLLNQNQHLTEPGTPESMSESEIDESKIGIFEKYFSSHYHDRIASKKLQQQFACRES